jgi:hypothetical protein
MKNLFQIFLFLTLPFVSLSQEHFIGLFGKSYLQTNKFNSSKMDRVDKSISIIYNSRYCSFFIENSNIKFFPIRSYSKSLGGGGIITSFVSQETNTTPDGYYGIIIQENNHSINLQINLNNITYYVDKIEKYSENGKVNGRISIKNYQELIKQTKINDSISIKLRLDEIENTRKRKYEDSLFNVQYIISKQHKEEEKLLVGNNYNNLNLRWLNDTIQSKVDIKENETFHNSFRVFIDKNGIITKLEPDNSSGSGNIIDSYLPQIMDIVVGRKVKPYMSPQNGKFYPSYSTFYVGLHFDPNKKRRKRFIK